MFDLSSFSPIPNNQKGAPRIILHPSEYRYIGSEMFVKDAVSVFVPVRTFRVDSPEAKPDVGIEKLIANSFMWHNRKFDYGDQWLLTEFFDAFEKQQFTSSDFLTFLLGFININTPSGIQEIQRLSYVSFLWALALERGGNFLPFSVTGRHLLAMSFSREVSFFHEVELSQTLHDCVAFLSVKLLGRPLDTLSFLYSTAKFALHYRLLFLLLTQSPRTLPKLASEYSRRYGSGSVFFGNIPGFSSGFLSCTLPEMVDKDNTSMGINFLFASDFIELFRKIQFSMRSIFEVNENIGRESKGMVSGGWIFFSTDSLCHSSLLLTNLIADASLKRPDFIGVAWIVPNGVSATSIFQNINCVLDNIVLSISGVTLFVTGPNKRPEALAEFRRPRCASKLGLWTLDVSGIISAIIRQRENAKKIFVIGLSRLSLSEVASSMNVAFRSREELLLTKYTSSTKYEFPFQERELEDVFGNAVNVNAHSKRHYIKNISKLRKSQKNTFGILSYQGMSAAFAHFRNILVLDFEMSEMSLCVQTMLMLRKGIEPVQGGSYLGFVASTSIKKSTPFEIRRASFLLLIRVLSSTFEHVYVYGQQTADVIAPFGVYEAKLSLNSPEEHYVEPWREDVAAYVAELMDEYTGVMLLFKVTF